LGWEIEAQLQLDDGHEVRAILTRERFNELNLKPEQRVYIKPIKAKSFPYISDVVGARA
jgi:sulfate transport system ATP-binding protein